MSVPSDSNGRPSNPEEAAGLLSNLPRTRPQRSTPRRAAARKAIAANTASQAAETPGASASTAPRSRPAKRSSAKASEPAKAPKARKAPAKARTRKAPQRLSTPAPPVSEPVPAQGFESEGEHAHGAVHPPSGAELMGSATEIIGELAKAGLSAGERLLRDVLSHLPLS